MAARKAKDGAKGGAQPAFAVQPLRAHVRDAGGLLPRERAFVAEYLKDLNGRQAAIRAGFAPKSASVRACNMLKRPEIQEAIRAANEKRVRKAEVTAERVIQELARIAFGDVRALFTERGELKPPSDWEPEVSAAIASVEVVTKTTGRGENAEIEYVHKVKSWDKVQALGLLARHLGILQERVALIGPDGGPVQVDNTLRIEFVRPKHGDHPNP